MEDELLDDFDRNNQPFEFYKDFFVIAQAEFVVNLLKDAAIPYQLDQSSTIIDEAIVGNSLTPKFVLKLPPKFFQKANDLIKENLVVDDAYVATHYLNQLEEHELIEILERPDEWSLEDGIVAREILANRGKTYSDAELQKMQNERLALLRTGKAEPLGKLSSYYLLILAASFFFSAYFVLAGLGLALFYWKDTNVDATGFKYYTFDAGTRKIGQITFWVWLVFMIPFFFLGMPLIWMGDVFSFSG